MLKWLVVVSAIVGISVLSGCGKKSNSSGFSQMGPNTSGNFSNNPQDEEYKNRQKQNEDVGYQSPNQGQNNNGGNGDQNYQDGNFQGGDGGQNYGDGNFQGGNGNGFPDGMGNGDFNFPGMNGWDNFGGNGNSNGWNDGWNSGGLDGNFSGGAQVGEYGPGVAVIDGRPAYCGCQDPQFPFPSFVNGITSCSPIQYQQSGVSVSVIVEESVRVETTTVTERKCKQFRGDEKRECIRARKQERAQVDWSVTTGQITQVSQGCFSHLQIGCITTQTGGCNRGRCVQVQGQHDGFGMCQ